eukprot:scaffold202946_cov21-Tisochrysis_lutea.AAC.1
MPFICVTSKTATQAIAGYNFHTQQAVLRRYQRQTITWQGSLASRPVGVGTHAQAGRRGAHLASCPVLLVRALTYSEGATSTPMSDVWAVGQRQGVQRVRAGADELYDVAAEQGAAAANELQVTQRPPVGCVCARAR